MLGLPPTAGKYFTFILIMGQNLAVWIGIGQTAAAYFPTADIAQLFLGCLAPMWCVLFRRRVCRAVLTPAKLLPTRFMFCGVFLQKSLIPEGASSNPLNNHPHIYFQWLYYLDFGASLRELVESAAR